eukprot:PRCOL_00006528-RA
MGGHRRRVEGRPVSDRRRRRARGRLRGRPGRLPLDDGHRHAARRGRRHGHQLEDLQVHRDGHAVRVDARGEPRVRLRAGVQGDLLRARRPRAVRPRHAHPRLAGGVRCRVRPPRRHRRVALAAQPGHQRPADREAPARERTGLARRGPLPSRPSAVAVARRGTADGGPRPAAAARAQAGGRSSTACAPPA